MDGLKEQAIAQWGELRTCIEALRLVPLSPIKRVIREATAPRVLVRRAVVRLHAARSAIADSAAALTVSFHIEARSGMAASGFSAFRELFKIL